MNKKEKEAVCSLVVEWEFTGTDMWTPEAAARNGCGKAIREIFNISDKDMAIYRAWEIAKIIGNTSDEFFDLLCAAVDVDYKGVLDALDAGNLPDHVKELE